MSVKTDILSLGLLGPLGVLQPLSTAVTNYGATGKSVASQTKTAATKWGADFGNIGLIIIGVILAIGALLISQKKTIVRIGDVAAKGAALAS